MLKRKERRHRKTIEKQEKRIKRLQKKAKELKRIKRAERHKRRVEEAKREAALALTQPPPATPPQQKQPDPGIGPDGLPLPHHVETTTVTEHEMIPINVGPNGEEYPATPAQLQGNANPTAGPPPPGAPGSGLASLSNTRSGAAPGSVSLAVPRSSQQVLGGSPSSAAQQQTVATLKVLHDPSGKGPVLTTIAEAK